MKIEFSKALLWLVPYLYLVSIMYYWGFWGTFRIDAFNYYQISDIIKGITAPISSPLTFISIMGGYLASVSILKAILDEWGWLNKLNLIAQLIIGASILIAYGASYFWLMAHFTEQRIHTQLTSNENENVTDSIILFISSCIIGVVITATNIKQEDGIKKISIVGAFALSLSMLPSLSFGQGKLTALRAKHNKEFSYVITDSIEPKRKIIYKYLGKTGEYYILIDLNNRRHHIISISKIDPITLENYSLDDAISLNRFRLHLKQLKATYSK
jgi:hypothetical protein